MDESQIADDAVDWASSHGLALRDGHVPLSIRPSPVPAAPFRDLVALQPALNDLVDAIARDGPFLTESLSQIQSDDFSARLLTICEAARSANPSQIWMGIHRSDYMLHQQQIHSDNPPNQQQTASDSNNLEKLLANCKFVQVELNTISAAFPALSFITSNFHKFIAKKSPNLIAANPSLPTNPSLDAVASALQRAWAVINNPDAVILMIVQPNERNIFDQRWIEYVLLEKYGVPLIRKTLAQINEQVASNSPSPQNNFTLIIDNKNVAVAYFRAGYSPNDHPSEAEWSARLAIETSSAIKCPPIAYQLAGTKKMQQILAAPGVLERFVKDPVTVSSIRSYFTGLYPLDDSPEGIAAYQRALDSPSDFVMKPQREGGGNNVYGQDIRTQLLKLSPSMRQAYILMDVIRPPVFQATLLKNRKAINAAVVSELGIYGTFIGDGSKVYLNESAGHLLRTKTSDSNEGGVAAGFAVLDSPLLVDV